MPIGQYWTNRTKGEPMAKCVTKKQFAAKPFYRNEENKPWPSSKSAVIKTNGIDVKLGIPITTEREISMICELMDRLAKEETKDYIVPRIKK